MSNNDEAKKSGNQQMISVNIAKLDQLQNLTGELVMTEAMVTQSSELDGLELDAFKKAARQLHKIINDVQDTVMSMRLVSLSSTFSRMHRVVRDMCKETGKDVMLELKGADTEVDKSILEHVTDPIMNIVKNAIEHGIDTKEERAALYKPEKGLITLEARNTGSDVLIMIQDDGRGINKNNILEKAKEKGLLRKPESEYSEKEIFQLIITPGFSNTDVVGNSSGNRIGLSTIQTSITAIGGTILVESELNKGTMFTLKIPLTLAIMEGMILRIGNAKYTIPINSITSSFTARDDEVFVDPNGNDMIMVRGEVYNLVKMSEFFGVGADAEKLSDGIVVMVEHDERTICMFVDELIGEQQVVVKSLPKYIKKIRGLSGCTLLGNSEISLIVDVAGFFKD